MPYMSDKRFIKWAGVILVIFYVGFALYDGPVWAKDSASYTGMTISREPVYPLFLAFFRMIFGEETGRNGLPAYLFPAVIAQALVNAYAVWVLVRAVLDAGGPVPFVTSPIFLAALAGDFQLIVALLNRFVAGRGSMYSEAILTESLAMPLYLIFVVRLWETYQDVTGGLSPVSPLFGDMGTVPSVTSCKAASSHLRLAIIAFLLIGLRKQMAVVLVLWGVVAVIKCVRGTGTLTHQVTFRTVPFVTVLTIFLVLLANNGFERAYNAAVHDRAVLHTGNGKGLMCTLLYSADPDEDAVSFQNCQTGGLCELFTEILAVCDEMGILKKNFDEGTVRYYIDTQGQQTEGTAEEAFEEALARVRGSGSTLRETTPSLSNAHGSWLALGEHYAASYDIIGYEVCDPMITAYLAERGFTGVDAEIAYDTIAQEFNRVLMKQGKGDLLEVFCINFAKGLVATNARIHPVLVPVSMLLYVLYVVVYIMLRRTVPFVTSNRIGTLRLAEITFLAILVNTGVVSLMIFPQPRYMIYNMGLFYTALAMMAAALSQAHRHAPAK